MNTLNKYCVTKNKSVAVETRRVCNMFRSRCFHESQRRFLVFTQNFCINYCALYLPITGQVSSSAGTPIPSPVSPADGDTFCKQTE